MYDYFIFSLIIIMCICGVLLLAIWIGILVEYIKYRKVKNGPIMEFDCGFVVYDTKDFVHRFEYWHGDQDGTLYKIIDDKKRIIIKSHISIEMADVIMREYEKTGTYPIGTEKTVSSRKFKNSIKLTSHS